jgi:hypothetical protein
MSKSRTKTSYAFSVNFYDLLDASSQEEAEKKVLEKLRHIVETNDLSSFEINSHSKDYFLIH